MVCIYPIHLKSDLALAHSDTVKYFIADRKKGFYLCFLAVLTFIYLICSLRTNLIFVLIFVTLDTGLWLLVGFYWRLAVGDVQMANKLQYAAGALTFTFCMLGWYLLLSIMLQTLEFPFNLPVFDLSQHFPSAANWRKNESVQNV